MKRAIRILMLLIVMPSVSVLLSSCNNIEYPLAQEKSEIVKIEIVRIDDYRYVSTGRFENIKTITEIENAWYDTFLEEFYGLDCKKSLGPSQECIEGLCVRFSYADGGFEIVGAETGFYYAANKSSTYPKFYFDYDEFNEFAAYWG